MNRVTAIVSAYYAKEYLDSRLRNLEKQTPRPEIVVVAQAGSEEAEIARIHNSILVTTPHVPTVYFAWNLAIESSTGEYITNANSDDLLYTGALELLSSTLDNNPEFALCYADCDVTKQYGCDPVNRFIWNVGGFQELLLACFIGPMPMWRKDLHYKYGYFDDLMHSAGDYEYWLRIAKKGERFIHIPRSVGSYLHDPDSAGHREPLRTLWETSRARSRYSNEL